MAKKRRAQAGRTGATAPSPRRPAPPPAQRRSRFAFSPRVLIVAVGAIAGVFLIAGIVALSATAKAYTCGSVETAPTASVGVAGLAMESVRSVHVATGTQIRYKSCPPTSGDHYAAGGAGPLRPSFYGPGDKATPGGWVHNLEHGYVVVLYKGEPDDSTVANLRAFARNGPKTPSAAACGFASKVLVARFDDLSTPFAALAWDRLLPMQAWDASAAASFAQRSIDATAPEPKAC